MLMDNITTLLGHGGGPSGNRIEPRACRYCNYYGHTKLWCKVRIANEEAAAELLLQEDRKMLAKNAATVTTRREGPHPQAVTFDELRIPYVLDPDLGPLVGAPGEAHVGKWTYDTTAACRTVVLRESCAESRVR